MDKFVDWTLVGSDRASMIVEVIRQEFDAWYRPNRSPTSLFSNALRTTLSALVLNVCTILISRRSPCLFVPMRKAWYAANRMFIGPGVTKAAIETCISFLVEAGYVRWRKGKSSRTVSFRVPSALRATSKLAALVERTELSGLDVFSPTNVNLIRLREAKKGGSTGRLIPFEETGETLLMRDNLVQINRGLLRHWPDLEITDQQWAEMDDYVSRKPNRPSIDLTQRTVYRVFNNGTFEDGGRFYGGWWQSVPKAYRPYITIDGKQTVEVDYSSMHPTILYAELGIPMPDDPYAFGSFDRQVVKRTINALLNAKSTNIKPVEGFSELAFGIRWSEFLAAVKTHAHDLEPYFGTGYGLKLQRLDSDIAEEVMLEFARSRIPILPVHDSFLVHHGNEDVLKLRMQERFRARVGVDVKLKTVILDEQVRIGMRRRGEATTTDLKELLELPGPYMAHDRRVAAWFTWKDSRAARKPLTDGTAYPLD